MKSSQSTITYRTLLTQKEKCRKVHAAFGFSDT